TLEKRIEIPRETRALLQQLPAKAVTFRKLQLHKQAALAEETDPVVVAIVQLRRGADHVVAMPAEALIEMAMLQRQLPAQRDLRGVITATELQPFERDVGIAPGQAERKH